jgi:hypothetical protein
MAHHRIELRTAQIPCKMETTPYPLSYCSIDNIEKAYILDGFLILWNPKFRAFCSTIVMSRFPPWIQTHNTNTHLFVTRAAPQKRVLGALTALSNNNNQWCCHAHWQPRDHVSLTATKSDMLYISCSLSSLLQYCWTVRHPLHFIFLLLFSFPCFLVAPFN